MNILRNWVLGILGSALISAAAAAITPDNNVKKVTLLACGMAAILAFISPFADIDIDDFSKSMAEIHTQSEMISKNAGETYDSLLRSYIENECETYILDKGSALGIVQLKVRVQAEWSEEGYWYPHTVFLTLDSDEQLNELAWYIKAELGISEDNQHWSISNENY